MLDIRPTCTSYRRQEERVSLLYQLPVCEFKLKSPYSLRKCCSYGALTSANKRIVGELFISDCVCPLMRSPFVRFRFLSIHVFHTSG